MNYKDNGLYQRILQTHSPTQDCDEWEADSGKTAMEEKYPELEVHSTAGMTFWHDATYPMFWALISNPSQPCLCTVDFTKTDQLIEPNGPKLQFNRHMVVYSY